MYSNTFDDLTFQINNIQFNMKLLQQNYKHCISKILD